MQGEPQRAKCREKRAKRTTRQLPWIRAVVWSKATGPRADKRWWKRKTKNFKGAAQLGTNCPVVLRRETDYTKKLPNIRLYRMWNITVEEETLWSV